MTPSRLAYHALRFINNVERFNRKEPYLGTHARRAAQDTLACTRAILLEHGWEPDVEDDLIMQEAGIHE